MNVNLKNILFILKPLCKKSIKILHMTIQLHFVLFYREVLFTKLYLIFILIIIISPSFIFLCEFYFLQYEL